MTHDPATITRLLQNASDGGEGLDTALLPLLLDELRGLAARHLRGERPEHTLQPTALVNEAWMKLVDQSQVRVNDRVHFLAIASRAMRQILVDHARRKKAQKRGGGGERITLDENLVGDPDQHEMVVALDEALGDLSALDDRKARVVELRFFGGMTIAESADVLGISPKTVEADWYFARAWLKNRLEGNGE